MNANLLVLGFVPVAAVLGIWALLGLRRALRDADAWRGKHAEVQLELGRAVVTAERVPNLERQVTALTAEITTLWASNSGLTAQKHAQDVAHQEQIAALTDVKAGIETHLKAMAAEVLQSNQGTFLELANQTFEKHKVGATADLEARQKAVADLIAPLKETLTSYRQQTTELERSRSEAYGALFGELKSVAETQNVLRTEASKLVQALRASPKTRGRWGEHTLQNVLELSGLIPYCDFQTEETFDRWESRVRPDVVVRLPGGRSLIVDAKTSTSAYLDAVEAVTDEERERHLLLHAAQTREHMKKLASKSYWDGLTETPDFVVMFIPGDNFYSAAVERDTALFEDAVALRVIIVTPSTLIALAKAVAFGWRQEKVAENARKVHDLGRELYHRITVMAEHIQNCGGALTKSVKCFNEFIGSLEQSVMPQVRRFNELEVEGTAEEIVPLKPIELESRLLRSDRDFAGRLAVSANSESGPSESAA